MGRQSHAEQGRKQKVLESLKAVDEQSTGLVKANVFFNLLACMDIGLAEQDEREIKAKHSKFGQVRYEQAIKRLTFDAIREEWTYQAEVVAQSGTLEAQKL